MDRLHEKLDTISARLDATTDLVNVTRREADAATNLIIAVVIVEYCVLFIVMILALSFAPQGG